MTTRDRFLMLLNAHLYDVRAFVCSMVADHDLRQDVFQDVSLTLWERFEDYDPSRPFGAWARGIAAKKILQLRHENRRFPLVFPVDTMTAILAAYDRTDNRAEHQVEALQECKRSLPEHLQTTLGLRYEQNLEVEEIASLTGRTTDAVYKALSRTRSLLAKCIRRRLSLMSAPACKCKGASDEP